MIKENASIAFPGIYLFLAIASVVLTIAEIWWAPVIIFMLAFPWSLLIMLILGGAMTHDDLALGIAMALCFTGVLVNTYIVRKIGLSAQYDTIRSDQD